MEPDTPSSQSPKSISRLHSLSATGAPKRHALTIPAYDGRYSDWAEALNAVEVAVRPEGSVVILIGPRGTGKTQIAVEAIGRFIETLDERDVKHRNSYGQADTCRYTTLSNMLLEIRDAMSKGSELDGFRKFTQRMFLVIDEVSESSDSDFSRRTLTAIVDNRYAYLRHTLLIGNIDQGQLNQVLGTSIVDRARESNGLIVMEGPSLRGPTRGA